LGPSLIAHVLHGERPGRGNGSGLLEREAGRLPLDHGFRNRRVLGQSAAVAPQVGAEALTEDLVARPEPPDVRADRLDHAGHVRARDAVLRRA
jgi:hypothetical protein